MKNRFLASVISLGILSSCFMVTNVWAELERDKIKEKVVLLENRFRIGVNDYRTSSFSSGLGNILEYVADETRFSGLAIELGLTKLELNFAFLSLVYPKRCRNAFLNNFYRSIKNNSIPDCDETKERCRGFTMVVMSLMERSMGFLKAPTSTEFVMPINEEEIINKPDAVRVVFHIHQRFQ
ncbi:MAG: hypothetical protein LBK29_01135 [Oscillospiraceae bacterium]|jgi:hypothetical protein|nr:hypothetical protein [Oscillospiraceae bacterium]